MDTVDFRSVDGYLGGLSVGELETLEVNVRQLVQSPAWPAVRAMLRIEREQHVRNMSLRVLDHAAYAHAGGMVAGLVAVETCIQKVFEKAEKARGAAAVLSGEDGDRGE